MGSGSSSGAASSPQSTATGKASTEQPLWEELSTQRDWAWDVRVLLHPFFSKKY